MANIIFRIFPIESHHNATYSLARELQENGHYVTYVGNSEIKKSVESQGFKFYLLSEDIFPPVSKSLDNSAPKQPPKERLNKYLEGKQFDDIIQNLSPDLIIVDSSFTRHVISVSQYKIQFIILETMVSLDKGPLNPPLNSDIIPVNSFSSKLKIELQWQLYFIKRFILFRLGILMPVKVLAKKIDFPLNAIAFNRYFQVGIKDAPEIMLSPKEFDFPAKKKANQFYINTSKNISRTDTISNPHYDKAIAKILLKKQHSMGNHKIVYCSFGGLSWRYKGVKQFLEKLIQAVSSRSDLSLVISTGKLSLDKDSIIVPSNVYIFDKIPQLHMLKNADLMITHAGINSIIECIHFSVPVLAYPATSELDQKGNAARVSYHKLGLRGDLLKDSSDDIQIKMNEILTNDLYRKNIKDMLNNIKNNNEYLSGVEVVNNVLKNSWTKAAAMV